MALEFAKDNVRFNCVCPVVAFGTGLQVCCPSVSIVKRVSPLPVISPCGTSLTVYGSRLGTVHSDLKLADKKHNTIPWCCVYELLEGLGFDIQQAFAAFEALCAGAFTDTFHRSDHTERLSGDPVLQFVKSVIFENLSDVKELNKCPATDTFIDFTIQQNEFWREAAKSTCLITDNEDIGLTMRHLYLSDGKYEIWATQRCSSFIILKPSEGFYRVIGAVSICSPYITDSHTWDSCGSKAQILSKC